ncbi:hypothetical protein [Flavobacterium sp.]|uniref:hypothetical protein n=1 Tax=Flavobacterium sp. TaxID=239 RepID=UPI00286E31E1|nr:hypothetical protein [Flavobacterium sp.]
MKNSKFTFLIIALLIFFSAEIIAQETDKRAEMIAQMKSTIEKLNLSTEQEVKFKEISKTFVMKAKEVKESDQNKRDKFKALKAMKDQKNIEMKALLSSEQYEDYLKIMEDRKKKV